MRLPRHSRLRILLTEDHASTRLGIKQILRDGFLHVEIGEAADAAHTLAHLEQPCWDLLVLDISLPDQHGLDLLQRVKHLQPALPVLIYSAHPEDQFAHHAQKAGAAGYLTKERAPEELCAAVRSILTTGSYASPGRLGRAMPADTVSAHHDHLSEREFQILLLTAKGKTGKAIAAELNLSQKTVSTYRSRVLTKLELGSVAELTQYAVRHGLV